jgi:nucleotide-binding universal stress UspA family protein
VTEGEATADILELAVSEKAQLVVVGHAGHTGLARMLLGSVAEEVVRAAPSSILVVR